MCSLGLVVISVNHKGCTLIAYILHKALCRLRWKQASSETRWISRSKALTTFCFVILRCVATNMEIIRTYPSKITYTHYNHFQKEKPGPKDFCLVCKIIYLEILLWYKNLIGGNFIINHLSTQEEVKKFWLETLRSLNLSNIFQAKKLDNNMS